MRDIHEWLADIGIRHPAAEPHIERVTYHESCHLCHGQKITRQPRKLLRAIPGLELVELPESNWCCGSAGIYNITQPEMSKKLLDRKLGHLAHTGATVVASANPGCSVQLEAGLRQAGSLVRVAHPISLLAEAFRRGKEFKRQT
jgi:glycolate oxidase iron-sulfur subunit